jgi:23S rRNA (adenine2503-C2)-methyltransferase
MEGVKADIRTAEFHDIEQFCREQEWKSFRARQIYSWIWQKGCTTFDGMTNLSLSMRQTLGNHFEFRNVKVDLVQESVDGTVKFRLELHDGHRIEAVLIPVVKDRRFTVCVSSQVGCSLSCKFCATGQMRRERNLTAAEIYDQVRIVNDACLQTHGHNLTNVVYMGMGEPLLNYREVLKSTERLSAPDGAHMSPRRITVSTAGIQKAIRRLADDEVRFNLALSLHAADDAKRNEIMPINEQNNLDTLMDAIAYFYDRTRGRISYEYIAFQGFNDSQRDAKQLAALCRRFPVRVNIIEYNPVPGLTFTKSAEDTIEKFARTLRDAGIMVTLRRSRGKDIDAACGQLANRDS